MTAELNSIEMAYRRLKGKGHSIINLYSGNPTEHGFHFPHEILQESYVRALQDPHYQAETKGIRTARRAISEYYSQRGINIDPEHILLSSGTSEAFLYLFTLLAKPGNNILVPNPAYPLFEHIAKLARIELRHYRLNEDQNWRIDMDELHENVDHRTKALLLISPHNPTGAVTSTEQIDELVAWSNSKGIPIICDEVFSEFYFGEGTFPQLIALAKPELCFTLNGISKMFALPQLKLGWIAVKGKPSLVEAAVGELEMTVDTFLSCHIPIQEALPALMKRGEDFCRSYYMEVRRRRDVAVATLSQSKSLRFVEPQGGFYLMFRVEKEMPFSEEDFIIQLMEKTNLFIHPGYFYDYEEGIHGVLSYLSEPTALKDNLGKILQFINNC